MSQENKPRTVQQVSIEYSKLAVKAGDLQYKIWAFKRDLELLTEQMQELNFEATAIHAADAAKAQAPVEQLEAPAQESASA